MSQVREGVTDAATALDIPASTIGPTLPDNLKLDGSEGATPASTNQAAVSAAVSAIASTLESAVVASSSAVRADGTTQLGDPIATQGTGEITRSGGPVAGIEYRSSSHPYKIFVGGISPQASEHDLFTFFERRIGTVAHVTVALDHMRPERYHKGYGFVVFASQELRNKALTTNRYTLMDRELEVKAVETGRTKMFGGQSMMGAGMMPGMMASSTGDVPDINKLFVAIKGGGGIGGLNEEELTSHFNHYGQVKKVVIVKDRSTGISKGYGFIYFATPEAPMVAISAGREHCIGPGRLRIEVKPFGVGAGGGAGSPYMSRPATAGAGPSTYGSYGSYGMYGAAVGYGQMGAAAGYGGGASYGGGGSPYAGSPYAQSAAGSPYAQSVAGSHPSQASNMNAPGMTSQYPRTTMSMGGASGMGAAGASPTMGGSMGQPSMSTAGYMARMGQGAMPQGYSYGQQHQ